MILMPKRINLMNTTNKFNKDYDKQGILGKQVDALLHHIP